MCLTVVLSFVCPLLCRWRLYCEVISSQPPLTRPHSHPPLFWYQQPGVICGMMLSACMSYQHLARRLLQEDMVFPYGCLPDLVVVVCLFVCCAKKGGFFLYTIVVWRTLVVVLQLAAVVAVVGCGQSVVVSRCLPVDGDAILFALSSPSHLKLSPVCCRQVF